ncbi:hypothetical protein CHS0354_014971 [Potamilus streckersoni]|uniref:Phospholipase A2 n=1 Tax=Potamilus streckersoni TaxID=2493646 RepID=A0AAE0VP72_9BIVA|nr:hypothetical protein CHS0354_014971 [Potamilus streckersoni]
MHYEENPWVFPSGRRIPENIERKVPVFHHLSPTSDENEVFSSSTSIKTNQLNKTMTEFDPYQIFEVEHKGCMILTVKVLCGRKITKGWSDYVDTPDPYIALTIRTAPDGRKRTQTIDNEVNPVWNETFTFLLDENVENIMEVKLMEANYGWDETLGLSKIDINTLEKYIWVKKTLVFNNVSEIDLEMKTEYDKDPTLRYSLALCDDEKAFLYRRREKVFEAMRQLLGEKGPECIEEVPTVSVIGSGGGFRAMVGLSGVLKALADSGIMQCTTYLCGLSGSSWHISNLYSHPDWPKMNPGDIQEEVKNNVDSSLLWLLTPQSIYRYMDRIMLKRSRGQPVSFTDFFGHMVGETLLKGRLDAKLTDMREKVADGGIPLPILTCVHVKKDRSARSFQEWVEFSPYEIGMAKYGTFMRSELFGSKFFMGKLCTQYEEPPLHFLQGIWGSAFCILFKRLLEDNRRLDPVEMIRQEMAKQLEENQADESSDSSESDDENSSSAKDRPPKISKRENIFGYNDSQDVRGGAENGNGRSRIRESTRRTKNKGYWHTFLKGLFENKNFELLSTRAGRAGVIHNFMRGLSLQQTYPFSPFTPQHSEDQPDLRISDDFEAVFEMHPTNVKHLYMVDAGLTFNSPYPVALRPQRRVDIILSFDFSARPSDSSPPFKELLLAEKWARIHKVPFPPIDTTVFDREGMKELYIFENPNDPHCPVVLHFPLVNIEFRKYLQPGVLRKTKEEMSFADFDIFDDPATPYSTFNFKYTHLAFDRLSKLTEFNTLWNVEEIRKVFAKCIEKKRQFPPKLPCELKDIPKLKRVSQKNKKRLSKFVSLVRSGKYKNIDSNLVDTISEEKSIDLVDGQCKENEVENKMDTNSGANEKRRQFSRQRVITKKGQKSARDPQETTTGSPELDEYFDATSSPETSVIPTSKSSTSINFRNIPGRRKPKPGDMHDARCNSIDEDDEDIYYSAIQ